MMHRTTNIKKSLLKCEEHPNLSSVDIYRVVHYEPVPPGLTANQCYYTDNLQHLQENVQQKRPEKWNSEDWILDHYFAHAHSALFVHEFLAKHNTVIPCSFYSPDLASRAFYILPELKTEEI